jgi:hypothetical protein
MMKRRPRGPDAGLIYPLRMEKGKKRKEANRGMPGKEVTMRTTQAQPMTLPSFQGAKRNTRALLTLHPQSSPLIQVSSLTITFADLD